MENQRQFNSVNDKWSNLEGYGLFCFKKCVAEKKAAGIPPKAKNSQIKKMQADADNLLAQAALEKVRKNQNVEEDAWTPMAVAGVVGASFLGIAIMVFIIKKAKK